MISCHQPPATPFPGRVLTMPTWVVGFWFLVWGDEKGVWGKTDTNLALRGNRPVDRDLEKNHKQTIQGAGLATERALAPPTGITLTRDSRNR